MPTALLAQVVAPTHVLLVDGIGAPARPDQTVVRGDPVRNPALIYDVVTVFKDGTPYDAATLRHSAFEKVGTQ